MAATRRTRHRPYADAPDPKLLLEHVARRVREHRHANHFTLKELSFLSQVSERFLVMLEKGTANPSILTLDEIAETMGTKLVDLLGDGPVRITRRLPHSGKIVALLGLRGAGKSSVGERAAQHLDLPFVELDSKVAERAGMSLGELFELHGSAYFRKLEREILEQLVADGASAMIATSGSLVTDHATYAYLRKHAKTIWLKAKPDDHMRRVVLQGDARPMANRKDAMNELKALLRARRPLYEQAAFEVDTSALGFERAVERVVRIVRDPLGNGSKTRPDSG